jgi:hypothetical protein
MTIAGLPDKPPPDEMLSDVFRFFGSKSSKAISILCRGIVTKKASKGTISADAGRLATR